MLIKEQGNSGNQIVFSPQGLLSLFAIVIVCLVTFTVVKSVFFIMCIHWRLCLVSQWPANDQSEMSSHSLGFLPTLVLSPLLAAASLEFIFMYPPLHLRCFSCNLSPVLVFLASSSWLFCVSHVFETFSSIFNRVSEAPFSTCALISWL